MKESDYVKATNLAKLRIALGVLKDVLPENDREEEMRRQISESLFLWILKLEKKVDR